MYIALKGIYDFRKAKLPMRFTVLYVWVFLVGLGSLLFHATLKWSMQMLDEVPMIYMACHILYCLMYPLESNKKAGAWRRSIIPCYGAAIAITAGYLMLDNPIFHEVCFAIILIASASFYPAFASSSTIGLSDAKQVRALAFRIFIKTALLMLSAFGIWNVDNVGCCYLRQIRSTLRGGPLTLLQPLFQWHAIWHILTVAAADYAVTGIVYMWAQSRRPRVPDRRQQREKTNGVKVEIKSKLFGCFPQLEISPMKE
jgi:dihydroceramidase